MITSDIIAVSLLLAVFFFVTFGSMLIAATTTQGRPLTKGVVLTVVGICSIPVVFGSILSIALFIV